MLVLVLVMVLGMVLVIGVGVGDRGVVFCQIRLDWIEM